MKKIVLLIVMAAMAVPMYATHYQQKGSTNDSESNYIVYEERLRKMPDLNIKPYYDFYGTCSGLKDEETGLLKTGLAEFVGASGRTHIIADIFKTYERRVRAAHGNEVSFVSNHDADVIAVINKKGDQYTIDIYTGQDALDKKAELQSEKK